MMRIRRRITATVFVLLMTLIGTACRSETTPTVLANDLSAPWGLAFLPNGTALITERDDARILSLSGGELTEVQAISGVRPEGEGGLLGIAVSPDYSRDKLIYIYYTAAEGNRIARFRLGQRPEPIVTGIPKDTVHNGGRLEFGPDGMLYATTGDATESGRAQDRPSLGGKILRMTPEGRPAPDNPFAGSLVYSYGHRNVQGIAWDARGRMFASEYGADTWDELNRIEAGKNYGWPTCEGACGDDRFVDPLVTWPTSEASPSGVAVHRDAVYLAALRGERLWRVPIRRGGALGEPEALFTGDYGRLRTVVVAPDNTLWVVTSNTDGRGTPGPADDRILRRSGSGQEPS